MAPLKEAEIIVGQNLPEEVLLGYVKNTKDIARAINRPVYFGGWLDKQSQQYNLDNTLIVPTAEEALYIAEAADQLAIFDLNNFEEIRTNAGIERLKQSGTYRSDAAVGYQGNLAEVGRRFAQARLQRRARIQEQLVGGLERPRQSRLTVPMTAEQRAASIIDYLNPNTGKPLFKKKPGSETLVSFANKLLELRGTRTYDIINSEEDRREVALIMAAEAEAALLSSRDALGWYGSTLKLAKQILYPVYPEISPTRPDGTPNSMHDPEAEHALASTKLTKKVKPALEEAPRDALDRTAIRDVANRARRILRENNQIAANLTNADFQALMWYAEKRIFDAGGVKRGRGEDNDYADGAIAIAKKKGISNAKIEAALPEAERGRGRVRSVEPQLAGDQDAGSRVGELVREPQEGDFFSPRRLTLVAENDTIEANMTPQERAEIREALQGVEIDPEMPCPMYSRIPVAEAYMPTRAPSSTGTHKAVTKTSCHGASNSRQASPHRATP